MAEVHDDKVALSMLKRRIAALEAENATLRQERDRWKRCVHFIARWAYRDDPPNSNHKLTAEERLNVIKHHPTVIEAYPKADPASS